MRQFNDLVQLDGFELLLIQNVVRSLHGISVFSVVDLKDGDFQVYIEESDKKKLLFWITIGGLCNFRKCHKDFKVPGYPLKRYDKNITRASL